MGKYEKMLSYVKNFLSSLLLKKVFNNRIINYIILYIHL